MLNIILLGKKMRDLTTKNTSNCINENLFSPKNLIPINDHPLAFPQVNVYSSHQYLKENCFGQLVYWRTCRLDSELVDQSFKCRNQID